MSDLTNIERVKLEKLFEMGGGYVLDFSNSSFAQFVRNSIGIEIYDDRYVIDGGSKAKLLRGFWSIETNYLVGKLTAEMLEYWRTQGLLDNRGISDTEYALYDECIKISDRLLQGSPLEEAEAILSFGHQGTAAVLAIQIRDSLAKDEPEVALDRLHTFTVNFVRHLCDLHSIPYNKDTPLHGLFGGYVKYLERANKIETEMTKRILKSSISIMDSFNFVRNQQSLAHDNPILNYNESTLIVNTVLSLIRFIEAIEEPITTDDTLESEDDEYEDIPF